MTQGTILPRGLLLGSLLVLAGCMVPSRPATPERWLDPSMAVMLAAAAGPGRGVDGVFALTVRASGSDRGQLYLNSERDYRNPRNLSIALTPQAQRELAGRLEPDSIRALHGRQVRVQGQARLVRIDFTHRDGQPSGSYYYQTQVRVERASQLQWD